MTDPIADLLTRIRNAYMAGHKTVEFLLKDEIELLRIFTKKATFWLTRLSKQILTTQLKLLSSIILRQKQQLLKKSLA